MYFIKFDIQCAETRQNFSFCPHKLHVHIAHFTVYIDDGDEDQCFSEEHLLENFTDNLTNSTYLDNNWTLKGLALIMKSELENLGIPVNSVHVELDELIGYKI